MRRGWLFAVLLVAACATAPPLPLTPQGPSIARVYVIDSVSGTYGLLPYDVTVDGRTVCTIKGEQFAVLDLDAGRHRFFLGGPKAKPQDFDVAAGSVTYLAVKMPRLRANKDASLVVVNDDAATRQMLASALRVETLLPSR
jgi:hypothetical protein